MATQKSGNLFSSDEAGTSHQDLQGEPLRRSKRAPKPLFQFNLDSTLESSFEVPEEPKPKPKTGAMKKKKKADPDFCANQDESSSSSSEESVGEPEFVTAKMIPMFEEGRPAIKNIPHIPTGPREEFRRCLLVHADSLSNDKSQMYHLWYLFVSFAKEMKKNPNNPDTLDLSTFLTLLRKCGNDTANLKTMLVQSVSEMTGRTFQESEIVQMNFFNDNDERLSELVRKIQRSMKENVFNRFIRFCCRTSINKNPFECDVVTIRDFLMDCLSVLQQTSVCCPLALYLKEILRMIKSFQKSETSESRQQMSTDEVFNLHRSRVLMVTKELYDFFSLVNSVDLGIDQVIGCPQVSEEAIEMTSDCKYLKYAHRHNISNFWREKEVVHLLKKVFREPRSYGDEDLTPQNAATMLGVSMEMLMAHKPSTFRPLVMKKYFDEGRPEAFWTDLNEVYQLILSIRQRETTLEEGAFHLGVALADLTTRVGKINSPKKVEVAEKPKPVQKPKPNPLEKLLKGENESDLSEYDVLRLRNIRERLDLFNKMEFNTINKKECAKYDVKKAGPKKVVPPREKSRRIQRKEAMKAAQETGVVEEKQTTTSNPLPPVPILLEDLVSADLPPGDGLKFLSCLEQEIHMSKENVKPEIPESIASFRVKSVCALFPEEIRSAAVMPNKEVNIVCAGGKFGSLGVWMVQEENKDMISDTSLFAPRRTYCNFKPHSDQINHVSFNPFSPTKVVTSSNDGFIRSTDLKGDQRSDTIFRWYNHNWVMSEVSISFHDFLSDNELVVCQSSEQGKSSAFIYDARSKKSISSIGSDLEFSSPVVALNPVNPSSLAGIVDKEIHIYDLRQMDRPQSVIEIDYNRGPSYAGYSPDGSQILLFGHGNKSQNLVSVVDLNANGGANENQSLREMSKNLASPKNDHQGNRPCVWHPTDPGSLVVLVDPSVRGVRSCSMVAINSNGTTIKPKEEIYFGLNYGLVAESSKGTVLALNALDEGSIAYLKIEED